jgi:hypothetical protein
MILPQHFSPPALQAFAPPPPVPQLPVFSVLQLPDAGVEQDDFSMAELLPRMIFHCFQFSPPGGGGTTANY